MAKTYSSRELRFFGGTFKTRTTTQAEFIENIFSSAISVSTGAAGSGKTICSVAAALYMLANEEVEKIILTRPIVEAGEELGFLPGSFEEKVKPYLLPLYDNIDCLISKTKREKLLEEGSIEILPLAYMRGRTIESSVIILDEAQNATTSQMKMFLTRLGKHGKAIVNGDVSQNDLKPWQNSGLADAVRRLKDIQGITLTSFRVEDVVRHKIIKDVIRAYSFIIPEDSKIKVEELEGEKALSVQGNKPTER